jgi:hypothetical protein
MLISLLPPFETIPYFSAKLTNRRKQVRFIMFPAAEYAPIIKVECILVKPYLLIPESAPPPTIFCRNGSKENIN